MIVFRNTVHFLKITRKYPLLGYILDEINTTAWDRLLGGDVLLRLYVRPECSMTLNVFLSPFQVYISTLFSKIFCFGDLFGGQEGKSGQTEFSLKIRC